MANISKLVIHDGGCSGTGCLTYSYLVLILLSVLVMFFVYKLNRKGKITFI
jgi:hypothetical protein